MLNRGGVHQACAIEIAMFHWDLSLTQSTQTMANGSELTPEHETESPRIACQYRLGKRLRTLFSDFNFYSHLQPAFRFPPTPQDVQQPRLDTLMMSLRRFQSVQRVSFDSICGAWTEGAKVR